MFGTSAPLLSRRARCATSGLLPGVSNNLCSLLGGHLRGALVFERYGAVLRGGGGEVLRRISGREQSPVARVYFSRRSLSVSHWLARTSPSNSSPCPAALKHSSEGDFWAEAPPLRRFPFGGVAQIPRRIVTIPTAAAAAAMIPARPGFSLNSSIPISPAAITPVSRSAATRASGAVDCAQTTIP